MTFAVPKTIYTCYILLLRCTYTGLLCSYFLDQPTVNSTINSPELCETHNCAVLEFTNVTIVCTTNGNPKPNVTLKSSFRTPIQKWKYHSMEYVNDFTWKWYYFFENVTRNHHGRYICRADNGIGSTADDALMLDVTCKFRV